MIEARRLHILRAVADHGTVTAAAAALYLTPSAVSQQLAALEQETGHRLVERGAKGVRLTPAGEILLGHTNAVLAQLERAEAELAAYASGEAGTVTVAAFATGIALVVAPAVARLAGTAPGIRVRVRDAEGDASLPMLLDRQVEVAVAVEYRGAPPADDPRLTHVPLYAEPFDAVVPAGHRLCDATEVPLAELAKDAWIGPYPGNPCHDVVMLACENAGFQPRPEHSSDDFRAVVALASAGAGVALVPRTALRGTDLTGVVVRPVDGPAPTRRVFAAVRRGGEGHPLIRPVLDALTAAAPR
ncbi:LysR family transcriptional regulator [Streptomyces griseoviridis]|jgi:DNA-binding transcriptional LysR family regulator|uniref:LysR family transcriptional regulator n=3 Tax=Streptomyces TaxID=1883 RepID=A0A918LD74_STRGD|nr:MULTISPECIES: LysR family transcriptional regulator [Streptomyces]MDP9685496.1 DNA-binding transcriptional LysR family regulator [Streptomyces griseoviridis]GGS32617.1 LysR family transcriptional regulator [Streptomyces niveoruber]GGS87857.1 LysR family transcriptional regulator [Streptomyces griseoviridis]GGU30060.1 LysR family transcriptional regulator [Streptomyces daghestanicus]GHI33066.1 LysR family transcriptional regulator [Streptomyces daghestanicus]